MLVLAAGKRFLYCFIIYLLSFPIITFALTTQQPLPIDQAFQLSTTLHQSNTLQATWKIAPGYYLYKERFQFHGINSQAIQLGSPIMPPGILHQDEIFGKYEV